jgi:hypothetical protein
LNLETILYIVIAAIISLIVTLFIYGYKTKYTSRLRWIFGLLRFTTLFSILVLLINPTFKTNTYSIEKPKLPVLVDNSYSIASLGQTQGAINVVEAFQQNKALNDKFDVSYFEFGTDYKLLDTLSFDQKNTNISNVLSSVQELFDSEIAPTIIVTDGNQTLGTDYQYSTSKLKHPLYPVILGDSIKYQDLKIQSLTSNRYSFLKNKFPVEAVLVYNGTGRVSSEFVVTKNNRVVYRKPVLFSQTNNTHIITFSLPAQSVGLQDYTASIRPLETEKNKVNNTKRFAVDVIDQTTNVLIVSSVLHPDIGMLKKAITTNEQRSVTFSKPQDAAAVLNDYQLVILYQPNSEFASVYKELKKLKKNTFVFTGLETDWSFVNSVQKYYQKEVVNQNEQVTAGLNLNYGVFGISPIGFSDFPPLQTKFGSLYINTPHQTILEQFVDGIASESPMLATIEIDGNRHAIWDGQDLWKWRSQSYRETQSFEDFDTFMGKMIQYLGSNKRRSRLEVSSASFYYNNTPINISAQYFDKGFVFDPRAELTITVVDTNTKKSTVYPLLLKNNFYEVGLNSLQAGSYSYTISVKDQQIARSGSFTILEFNIEQQFLNANSKSLERLALKTGGAIFYPSQIDGLIDKLITNQSYVSTEKSQQKAVPLIFIKWLLALIAFCLSIEWFIRKFNGLI